MASLYAETHDNESKESPERQLWCAVIHRAAHDAFECASGAGTNVERDRLQDDARAWFERNDEDFRLVCHAAGFDPDYVRNRVLMRIAEAASGNRATVQKSANGAKANGHANGHTNGHANGHANGHGAKNGHANGVNGLKTNGHANGANGHKTNGHANGHAANGNGAHRPLHAKTANGHNGHDTNGHFGHHGANGGRKPTVVVKKIIKHRPTASKAAAAHRAR